MKKIKKEYVKPDISVTQVEVESTICADSVTLTNDQDTQNGAIQAQDINQQFTPQDGLFESNTGTYGNGWNDAPAN